MQIKLIRTVLLALAFSLLAEISLGQTVSFPKPRKERLLNDLNILIWNQPKAKKIAVNLRIHSGSAFDPVGKEGTAKLLSEVMFPDNGIFEDFEEDLGGSLHVTSNYDFVEIEMTARPDKLVEILEILAGAVISPQIDTAAAGEAKKARIEKLSESLESPPVIADLLVAERLYGDFPYGRSPDGTVESIPDIDFADIIFAKQRFLTADNATLSISGDVNNAYAYRAARRLLGGWKKGSGRVPSNFTLPEKPDAAPLVVNTDSGVSIEQRFAVDAVSRKDPDHYAAKILARILDARLQNKYGGKVLYNYYYLRGYFVMSQTVSKEAIIPPELKSDETGESESRNLFSELLLRPVEESEFSSAKSQEIADFKSRDLFRHWFDIDTYELKSVEEEFKKLENVKVGDLAALVQKLSSRPIVDVSVLPLDSGNPVNNGDPDDPR